MNTPIQHRILYPASTVCPAANIFYRRRRENVRAARATGGLNWDPEGLLGAPQGGHIMRREFQRLAKDNEGFTENLKKAQEQIEKEVMARRMARVIPEAAEDFVEYFLNTGVEDMEFEITRHRPRLTKDFFIYLDKLIGNERFSNSPDRDRLTELESLRDYLQKSVEGIDKRVGETGKAVEKMKNLLMAKDKKAAILEMVSKNEIDAALLELLKENQEAAVNAGEKEKSEFIYKIYNACKKYYIKS